MMNVGAVGYPLKNLPKNQLSDLPVRFRNSALPLRPIRAGGIDRPE